MLVITRKKDETVILTPIQTITLTPQDQIEVSILEIRGGRQCRVGIEAPASIRLTRGVREAKTRSEPTEASSQTQQ